MVKPAEDSAEYVLINNVSTQTSFSLDKEDRKEVGFISNYYVYIFDMIWLNCVGN